MGTAVNEDTFSGNQTTILSQNDEYVITGYKSTVTTAGMEYEITAVESKNFSVFKDKFLARQAQINATPEEILYILMQMFNSKLDGKTNINSSTVKIYAPDIKSQLKNLTGVDTNFDGILVEELDASNGTDEDAALVIGKDTYEQYQKYDTSGIDSSFFKQVTLSFGGESARQNYRATISDEEKAQLSEDELQKMTDKIAEQDNKKHPVYKTIASLMDEFCAACPPLRRYKTQSEEEKTTIVNSETGEEFIATTDNESSYPLKWMVRTIPGTETKDDNGNTLKSERAIILYYRVPIKPGKIRRYFWGPENSAQTCITNLSIENSNEFAMLSAVSAFNASNSEYKIRFPNSGTDEILQISATQLKKDYEAKNKDFIDDGEYSSALGNSLYEGTIEILGDPFYSFDDLMMPCCYPIYIGVQVPCRADESGPTTSKRIHSMSGYYVIKEITHSISSSGYKTVLSVMSYPGIEKDVLKEEQKSTTTTTTTTTKS